MDIIKILKIILIHVMRKYAIVVTDLLQGYPIVQHTVIHIVLVVMLDMN